LNNLEYDGKLDYGFKYIVFWMAFRGHYVSWVHLIKNYLFLLILILIILAIIAIALYGKK